MKTGCAELIVLASLLAFAGIAHGQYVEDSIDVGGAWVGGLAYNTHADVVYGASEGGAGAFFAISCDSNRVVARFALRGALWVCYDSLDNKAYCTYHDYNWNDSLLVVDGSTHARVKAISIPGATIAVWDPVSDRVYTSCQNSAQIAVVDARGDSILTYIPVGACPMKMYINTRRHKLYVLNYDDGTVSIVNMTTNEVIKTVAVGGNPNAGYYCWSADKFYSAGSYGQCAVIGGLSDTVVARIPLPGTEDILGATGDDDAGLVYLGTFTGHDDYLATVMAQNDSVVATAQTGRVLYGVAYSGQSGLLYSASAWSNEVYVLSADGARVLGRLQVGDYPFVFAYAPRHRRLYLGHLGSSYVYVLRDTATGAIAEPQSPHPGSRGISITPSPFSQSVTVAWSSPLKGDGAARVYAQDGRLVTQARIPAGKSRWVWDGRDERGARVPPGVYVLAAPGGVRAKAVKLR